MGPSKLYVFQQVGTPAQTSKPVQELGVKQGAILVKEYMAFTKRTYFEYLLYKISLLDFRAHFYFSKWSCYDITSQSACKMVLLWRHQPIILQIKSTLKFRSDISNGKHSKHVDIFKNLKRYPDLTRLLPSYCVV